jgi:hypothetical protein
MKKKYKILIIISAVLLIFIIYANTNRYIKNHQWKHRNGATIGDWIEFDNVYFGIDGRVIYKKNIPKGKVVFCFGKLLIIREISSGEIGYYISKSF